MMLARREWLGFAAALLAAILLTRCPNDDGTYNCSRNGGVNVRQPGGEYKCQYPDG